MVKSETLVMFRTDVRGQFKGDVTAIFPLEPGTCDPSTFSCYAHIGQHCAGTWGGCFVDSRPATPTEYGPLLNELLQIGYDDLRIVKRTPRNARQVRESKINR